MTIRHHMPAGLLASSAILAVLLAAGSGHAQDDRLQFTYLTQTGIDNSFWQAIKRGMDDACEQFDADCQLVFTQENGNLQMHLQNLETVIEQGVDGIVTVVVNDDLYDDAIQRAVDRGIPVITANVDDTQGAEGNARLAFVGQDLYEAGKILAQALSEKFPAEGPVHVLLGLSRPGESWAEDRINGAKEALEEYKAAHPDREVTWEVIDSSNDISVTASRVCQYVQGHPETTAYVDAGFWGAGAGECLRDLGIEPGQLLMATFDLVPIVLDEMKEGYVTVTIDQQPYLQGYVPIMELALMHKYGLGAFDVNTGKAVVTPDDVADVEQYVAQGVR